MIKPIKSILFATDLTPNCQRALEFTITVSARFQATFYMLYVIERLPEHLTERVKGILGNHQWDQLMDSHQINAHQSLMGKQSASSAIKESLQGFYRSSGLPEDTGDFHSREIIISNGDLVEDILDNARRNQCDLIVLGGRRSLFSQTAIGNTTKSVLKRSDIPVTVVPS